MKLSDCLSRLTFHSTGATEWLCFRLELLSTITFALSLVIVVSTPEGTVNPSKPLVTSFVLVSDSQTENLLPLVSSYRLCRIGYYICTQSKQPAIKLGMDAL